MNVNGEDTRLWINEHQRQDGTTWNDYSVGISKKNEDGTYTNTYMKVRFAKSVQMPATLPNGVLMDFSGFLTVDAYKDREGNEVKKPMIMITKAAFMPAHREEASYEEAGAFSASDDAIPF